MAQLRHDFNEFVNRNAVIIVLGPDGPNAFKKYWAEQQLPFIGCSDIKSRVADLYHQEVNLIKLGRMPAMFIIDRHGSIRYLHYADSMQDIPPNSEILEIIDNLINE